MYITKYQKTKIIIILNITLFRSFLSLNFFTINKINKEPISSIEILWISKNVIIASDCYIGANVTILGGVTIGERCIVGSCSLVNKSLEGGYIYAGVPAKKIRKI